MGFFRFGHHHHPTRFLIQTMNNAGTIRFPNRAKGTFAMVQKSMHEGILPSPVSWMDDHAGGFVQNNQILVLVKNRKGDIRRPMNFCLNGCKVHRQKLAGSKLAFRIQGAPVFTADFSFFDCFFDTRPTGFGKSQRQDLVRAFNRPLGTYKPLLTHRLSMPRRPARQFVVERISPARAPCPPPQNHSSPTGQFLARKNLFHSAKPHIPD